jgi:hypothetical protein
MRREPRNRSARDVTARKAALGGDRFVDKFHERPLPPELPAIVRDRLRSEGVSTVEDWQRLGTRRYQLFGITRLMADQVDAAIVKAAR